MSDEEDGSGCYGGCCGLILIICCIPFVIILLHLIGLILYGIGAVAIITLVLGYFFPRVMLEFVAAFVVTLCVIKMVQILSAK